MFCLHVGLNTGGCFWKDEVCTKTDKTGSVARFGGFGGSLTPPAPPTHADPLSLGGSIFRPLCKQEQTVSFTVKLGYKDWLDSEQPGNSEPFHMTNLLVYFINSEQLCNNQKVPYHHV
jgi:hypothetical protein